MNGRCDVKMKLLVFLCYGILRVGGCLCPSRECNSSIKLLEPGAAEP